MERQEVSNEVLNYTFCEHINSLCGKCSVLTTSYWTSIFLQLLES